MASKGKTVLIADDSPDSRAYVRAALEGEGYSVIEAEDGVIALALARSSNPDLVILDVEMPNKTGFEVFDELRTDQETRSIPIIMLTGVRRQMGEGLGSKEMGKYYGSEPQAYVDKPVDAEELVDVVAGVLGE